MKQSENWPPDQGQKAAELRTECHSRPTERAPVTKYPDGGKIAPSPPVDPENANGLVSDWVERFRAIISD